MFILFLTPFLPHHPPPHSIPVQLPFLLPYPFHYFEPPHLLCFPFFLSIPFPLISIAFVSLSTPSAPFTILFLLSSAYYILSKFSPPCLSFHFDLWPTLESPPLCLWGPATSPIPLQSQIWLFTWVSQPQLFSSFWPKIYGKWSLTHYLY